MSFETKVVNWTQAHELINSTYDPITKELLLTCLGILSRQFVKTDSISQIDYDESLPTEPFDAYFYLKLIQILFKNKDRMIQFLKGDQTALDDFAGI